MTYETLTARLQQAETAGQIAEVCRLEAEMLKFPECERCGEHEPSVHSCTSEGNDMILCKLCCLNNY